MNPRLTAAVLFLFLPVLAVAQDKVKLPKELPPIRLPDGPPAPTPPPKPACTVLSGSDEYIVDSDIACTVLVSPLGLVNIAADTGPLRIRAKFVDSAGIETRTYKGKFLYILEAAGTGNAELLIVPGDGSAVIRRCLSVTAGPGPPPPPPPPPPPVDPFVKAIRDAYALETDPKRAEWMADLSNLYVQAADAMVPNAKTVGELFSSFTTARKLLIPDTGLVAVRKVVGTELNAVLGTDASAPLDRVAAAFEFAKVGKALGIAMGRVK